MRSMVACLALAVLLFSPLAGLAEEGAAARTARAGSESIGESATPGQCANGRSKNAAMWLSIAHPGLGEWYLREWGYFFGTAPQRRFWLGFIPFYGWPGYLQVRSAIDSANCRWSDDL